MLFMKGDPTEPKCGFSKTTVGILAEYSVDYKTFDILTDNEVIIHILLCIFYYTYFIIHILLYIFYYTYFIIHILLYIFYYT